MAMVKVAAADAVGTDSVIEVMVGETPYAVCNVAGKIRALYGVCPHRGGPLGQGMVEGDKVVCPWHAWAWDVKTGATELDSNLKVQIYPMKIENGDGMVKI